MSYATVAYNAGSAARPTIPRYLTFCIRQALFRPGEPVPTRLGYLVACADSAGLVGRLEPSA